MRELLSRAERIPGTFHRVAVFGGIYNNWIALERALELARERNCDLGLCLGDLGGFGPHPDRTIELLRRHDVRVMQGNYDVSVSGGLDDCGCGYTDPRDNHFAQISYDYTAGNTSPENKQWMKLLPAAFQFQLGDVNVLTSHGSPRRTNEFLWESATPDALIRSFLDDSKADLILTTHTGIKWRRRLEDGRGLVNVGVLGRPENDGSTRVWFTMLESSPGEGWKAEFIPVDYDHRRLAKEMKDESLPEEFIETVLTGWWTTCLEILPAKERLRGRY